MPALDRDDVLSFMPVGVYRTDAAGSIQFYNEAAAKLWGQRPPLGTTRWCGACRLFRPDGRLLPPESSPLAESLRTGTPQPGVELIAEQPSGTRVRFVAYTRLLADGDVVTGCLGVLADVSHLAASDLNAAMLAAIVESSDDAIISKTLDGTIRSWNQGATRLLGYEADEMIGQNIRRIIPAELLAEEDMIIATLRQGRRVDHFETVRQAKSGKTIQVSVTVSPIYDRFGTLVGASKIAREIGERRELEARLRQAQKLEAIGQLTGGIAHDFNNLLAVILPNAEALAADLSERPALQKMADMTASAAERGAQLTQRLLAFARKQPLEPRPVDVNKLVSGMDTLLRRSISQSIEIEIVHGGGLWQALIDPSQLEGAILNLAINARDAMPRGGRLTIETANFALDAHYAASHTEVAPGQYVMLSVSDNGTGMDRETAERAFEPFFTTKPAGSGSGLGLSMVYGFVKQSKGHVKIYSEPDQGTTVKLYLPRVIGPDVDPALAGFVAERPVGGGEKILIVEDNELVAATTRQMLADLGYRVGVASNGASALALLKEAGDYDLLFTDIVMPGGMNGRELADTARRLFPNLLVLFTSGYTENAIIHQGRLDQGEHLISKPYRRSVLGARIRALLDSRGT